MLWGQIPSSSGSIIPNDDDDNDDDDNHDDEDDDDNYRRRRRHAILRRDTCSPAEFRRSISAPGTPLAHTPHNPLGCLAVGEIRAARGVIFNESFSRKLLIFTFYIYVHGAVRSF